MYWIQGGFFSGMNWYPKSILILGNTLSKSVYTVDKRLVLYCCLTMLSISREKLDELEKSSDNSPLRQDSIAEEDEGCPNIAEGSDAVGEHFKKREAS